MRRTILTILFLGLTATQAFAGSMTTVGAGANVTTTASASSKPGGTAVVTSFGLAGSLTTVGPTSATTVSTNTTQTNGFALGNASFSGSAKASAHSFGYSSWQSP